MKILLVDDDSAVIQALLATLKALPGHEVRVATSGAKALENAATAGGVDLLITDVVMDPMDGFTLRDQLAAQYPGMRTILMSGYDLTDYPEQTAGYVVLTKPVEISTLREAVERETRPVPVVKPAAVPVAQPRATAVAAAPKAQAAIPTVRAVATPAAPRATQAPPPPATPAPPAPKAAPVATPRAVVAQASPVARATPAATPVAAPVALATPAATPVAMPVATPIIGATPGATPAPPPPPAPAASPLPVGTVTAPQAAISTGYDHSAAAGLIGQMVGGYQILSQLGEGRWGAVYAAIQTSINRPVGLKVLDPVRARDETQRQRFTADARAKANVQHPSILAVYEAGESDGWIFYTHEYVDGQNLAEMSASGRNLDENTALKIMRVAAEGAAYLARTNTPHSPLAPDGVYLGQDGHARLANPATQYPDQPSSPEGEMRTLARALLPLLPPDGITPGLRALMGRMVQGGPGGLAGWGAVLQAVKALEPKVVPLEAGKISAQDRAAIAAVEAARKGQKRSFYINVASMVSLVFFAGWALWYFVLRDTERALDAQVEIPAGTFLFGPSGQSTSVGAFSIDKYEITMSQYGKFVDWINKNPSEERTHDHPKQPREIESHIPKDWNIFYKLAQRNRLAHGVPISMNSPAMEITWYDAYAYAKWRGRDLPTEQEWERAARGTGGLAYPWGDEANPKKANLGGDFNAAVPSAKGTVDGYNHWSDVDAIGGDKSPDGVIGMAGNQSEWTSTWTEDNRFPVMKGGNFTKPPTPSSERVINQDPRKGVEHVGFRTVKRAGG